MFFEVKRLSVEKMKGRSEILSQQKREKIRKCKITLKRKTKQTKNDE